MGVSTTPWYVAIGASGAEGFSDAVDLLGEMPLDSDAIFMVVLHRPSSQPSLLQSVLQRRLSLPVQEAVEAETLQPGVCYIGKPAEHLTLTSLSCARLVDGRGDIYRNRTVDLLFDSLGTCARRRGIGIVLSGAFDDGSRGLAAIHRGGGVTMVLHPGVKSRGMQQNAIEYNRPVDFVGGPAALAAEVRRVILKH
jgi:two-component system chemotaxis response regulator CheB